MLKNFFREFETFAIKGNAIDLAVGERNVHSQIGRPGIRRDAPLPGLRAGRRRCCGHEGQASEGRESARAASRAESTACQVR